MLKQKLIVFDVGGVISRSSLYYLIHKYCKVEKIAKKNFKKFIRGELAEREMIRRNVSYHKGVSEKLFIKFCKKIPLIPGVKETFKALRSKGYKIALISSDYSTYTDYLEKKFRLEHAYGCVPKFKKGRFTEISRYVTRKTKPKHLKEIARLEGISTKDCVAVGNMDNDINLLKTAGLSISFNGTKKVEEIADVKVRSKNLKSILKYL